MARRLDLSPIGVSVGRESKAREERGGLGYCCLRGLGYNGRDLVGERQWIGWGR